jgi:hypothetical protein
MYISCVVGMAGALITSGPLAFAVSVGVAYFPPA